MHSFPHFSLFQLSSMPCIEETVCWAPRKANLGEKLTTAHDRVSVIETLARAPSAVTSDMLHRLLRQGGYDSESAQQLLLDAGRLHGRVDQPPSHIAPRRLF